MDRNGAWRGRRALNSHFDWRDADDLATKLKERIPKLKTKDGMEDDADMWPVVTDVHRQKILGYIEDGIASGALLEAEGCKQVVSDREDGFDLGATLFDHVTRDIKTYREEFFGPILGIVRVENFADAIAPINATSSRTASRATRWCDGPLVSPRRSAWSASTYRSRCRWRSTRRRLDAIAVRRRLIGRRTRSRTAIKKRQEAQLHKRGQRVN